MSSRILARFGSLVLIRINVGGGGGAPIDNDPRDCPPLVERGEDALDCPSAPTDGMHEAPEVDYGGYHNWRRWRYSSGGTIVALILFLVLGGAATYFWMQNRDYAVLKDKLTEQVEKLKEENEFLERDRDRFKQVALEHEGGSFNSQDGTLQDLPGRGLPIQKSALRKDAPDGSIEDMDPGN